MGLFGNLIMGLAGNSIRRNSIKQTSQTIYSVYQKIKREDPKLSGKEILELLIMYRRPFWDGDFINITFKGYPAFVLYDDLGIGDFILLINIWESIIADPSQIKDQSTTMSELKVMIKEAVEITFEALGVPINSENNTTKDQQIENYFSYTIDEIKKLGGRID